MIARMLLAGLVVGWCSGIAAGQELSETECRGLQQQLLPAEGAAWLSIPWRTSLLDAQRKAARDQKPIFIWAMDGHPLGCT